MIAVGVDACPGGWVAVVIDESGFRDALAAPTIDGIAARVPEADGFGIDIPIGLVAQGFRTADRLARIEAGPRGRSVWMTPPRPVLEQESHAQATVLAVELTGAGVSRQAHGLRRKILEVDEWLAESPQPVWEVHPEISFAALGGRPMPTPKDSWNGAGARRRLLEQAGGVSLPDDLPGAARAQVDDVLDAAVVAWSCRRLLRGQGRCRPDPPQAGADGRAIAIWS